MRHGALVTYGVAVVAVMAMLAIGAATPSLDQQLAAFALRSDRAGVQAWIPRDEETDQPTSTATHTPSPTTTPIVTGGINAHAAQDQGCVDIPVTVYYSATSLVAPI